MNPAIPRGRWVILASLVLAGMLVIVPMPDWAVPARPQWVALVLLYWAMALPSRVGVTVAWLAGLFQDALVGSLLGQHALAFALIAWIILKLHRRMRLMPVWQQALTILLLLYAVQLVLFWVNGFVGRPVPPWQAWLAPVIGAALWPWVFFLLRTARRHFGVQ
ncbi:rod shape-determining protein MreD [Alkalilimnicola ehrlichii MLHE-1]|uniref:Rod shape-determining protein MreD n=1 Tax=Alkalilimnicola ehrlichii (strain ATCC BAA-1101 / DSM 17681 / MLHE-1) TaxID=187272 RepID=Q0ACB1_ALKEH|nr:rod shape-determining protein MreD [Alkalilimnicola ehrlichii]ABI55526.1 Rod shape-determining protein MreD [Alkalilimnicola ehrlichii MLHE-1]